MFFLNLTPEQRNDIASQVAEMIDTFTNDGKLGGAPIPPDLELCESCPEVILDLPRDWKSRAAQGAGIRQWVRRPETWHHQLRSPTQEFGFARSIESKGGSHRVIEVVPSTVAREFQKAVRLVDAEAPESELPAVLLHVPRYSFYGLATVAATGPEKVGLDKITLVSPLFQAELPIAEWKRTSLLSFLSDLPDTFGAVDPRGFWRRLFSRLYSLLRRWLSRRVQRTRRARH